MSSGSGWVVIRMSGSARVVMFSSFLVRECKVMMCFRVWWLGGCVSYRCRRTVLLKGLGERKTWGVFGCVGYVDDKVVGLGSSWFDGLQGRVV